MTELRLRAIADLPEVRPGDDLGRLLAPRVPAGEGVLVVAQKIVSKAEGRIVQLSQVEPSPKAESLPARPRRTHVWWR